MENKPLNSTFFSVCIFFSWLQKERYSQLSLRQDASVHELKWLMMRRAVFNNEIKVMTVSLDFPLSFLTLLIALNHCGISRAHSAQHCQLNTWTRSSDALWPSQNVRWEAVLYFTNATQGESHRWRCLVGKKHCTH